MNARSSFLLVLLFSASNHIGHATEISGQLSGLLPLSGSPYQVVGDIWVPPLYTLTIEPGVILDFQGYYKFSVKMGALLTAVGIESDSIVFTCDTTLFPESWVGIRFDTASSTSVMQYCRVENAMGSGVALIRCSPLVQYCLIKNNRVGHWLYGDIGGGIVYLNNSNAVIRDCTISGNSSSFGGGIGAIDSCFLRLEGNVIIDNGNFHGAGIWVVDCAGAEITNNLFSQNSGDEPIVEFQDTDNVEIIGNVFSNNTVPLNGAVFSIHSCTNVTMNDNLITNNLTVIGFYPLIDIRDCVVTMSGNVLEGNTIYRFGSVRFERCAVNFINNIVANNRTIGPQDGYGVKNVDGTADIINCIVWNNDGPEIDNAGTISVGYSDIQGGFPGVGNIDTDPLFRDTTAGDFHLMSTACGDPFDSPCIDAGHPLHLDDTLSCQWGLGDSLADMGAYGGGLRHCIYQTGDVNDDGQANGVDVTYAVNYLKGYGPFPPQECGNCPASGESLHGAGDVNGNCQFNGVDVTYYVNYLKGLGPALAFCPNCPPMVR